MKAEDIRALDPGEVHTRIGELEEERFRLRFRSGTEALEDALRLRSIRRDIARLHTIARERALGIVRVAATVEPTKRGAKKAPAKKALAKKATKAGGR
ncbi:MAG: 50S ribosomal protein L29 [Gemmatimonadota bacterium]|nr:50S ribosomal protein L29 [Gemmatimonadota bacterium]